MPTVYVRDGESLNSAIERFSYKCKKAKIREECAGRAGFQSDKEKVRKKLNRKIWRKEYRARRGKK